MSKHDRTLRSSIVSVHHQLLALSFPGPLKRSSTAAPLPPYRRLKSSIEFIIDMISVANRRSSNLRHINALVALLELLKRINRKSCVLQGGKMLISKNQVSAGDRQCQQARGISSHSRSLAYCEWLNVWQDC